MTSRVCACAARFASIPRLPRIARPLTRPSATLSPLRGEKGNDSTQLPKHARHVRRPVDDGHFALPRASDKCSFEWSRLAAETRTRHAGARTSVALNTRALRGFVLKRARTRTNSASTRAGTNSAFNFPLRGPTLLNGAAVSLNYRARRWR